MVVAGHSEGVDGVVVAVEAASEHRVGVSERHPAACRPDAGGVGARRLAGVDIVGERVGAVKVRADQRQLMEIPDAGHTVRIRRRGLRTQNWAHISDLIPDAPEIPAGIVRRATRLSGGEAGRRKRARKGLAVTTGSAGCGDIPEAVGDRAKVISAYQAADGDTPANRAGGVGIVYRASGIIIPHQSANICIAGYGASGIGKFDCAVIEAGQTTGISIRAVDCTGSVTIADRSMVMTDQSANILAAGGGSGGVAVADRTGIPAGQPSDILHAVDRAGHVSVTDRAGIVSDQSARIGVAIDKLASQSDVFDGPRRVAEQSEKTGRSVDSQAGNSVARTVEDAGKGGAVGADGHPAAGRPDVGSIGANRGAASISTASL